MLDNADTFKPGDVIGGILKTLQPVPVLTAGGEYRYTSKAGQTLGAIDSFVLRDGSVYWLFPNNTSVKHGQNLFDLAYLEKSLKLNDEQKQVFNSVAAFNKTLIFYASYSKF